jgi:alanine dehydrogenase
VLVCGCGDQAAPQVAALRGVLAIDRVLAWDRDSDRSRSFVEAQRRDGLAADVATDLAAACLSSDVIVTCTTARSPFLEASFVRSGTFVAAVGADSPEKSEVHPELMRRALVTADVLDQCVAMGDLRHAIAAGVMTRADVHAELAELVNGAKRGRVDDAAITLFDSTGTALQDVAAAAAIYAKAVDAGRSRAVAFGTAA